ncbi:integrase core domain-containing protein [Amycolatopsis bartoniae]|nr:DDE-type integrase/transposase/recombinase [Amycolatopsis bartoniae]
MNTAAGRRRPGEPATSRLGTSPFRYWASVPVAYSRRIAGWSINNHMRTELVIDALGMATLRRTPESGNTILHSDHGSQFTAWAFGQRLRAAGILPSMGSVGDCYDNSMMESFWGALQLEVLDTKIWKTRDKLVTAIFEWIGCWYNRERRHSRVGMLSPAEFEVRNPERPTPNDER